MVIFLVFIIHWFSALFCQSFFLHRYCSHHMFRMNGTWEKFFYLLTFITQGPSFLNPSSYAILHQRHHSNSDTNKDPHSPHHSNSAWSMMVKTYKIYTSILNQVNQANNNNQKTCFPRWKTLDNFAQSKFNLFMWAFIYTGIYYYLKIELIYYLLIPIHFFIGPIQGAMVNWFGHKIGYRNYSINDNSKNTLPIDFALMGELYQNNHHKLSQNINFAHRWYEIDFTYQITLILKKLGIITLSEEER